MIAQVLAVACAAAQCATAHAQYSMQPYASGFDNPVYVTAARGDASKLYVVEKVGRIRIVQNGHVTGTLLDITGNVSGGEEQGLLSVAFDPKYASNHRFYVDYTDTSGDTRVVAYTGTSSGNAHATRQLLFVDQPYENHNGGLLQLDRNGYLYVGMGDGGSAGDPGNRAQNLGVRLGKLLRINPARAGAKWQVVGYGLRNPWRYSFDRANGDLWIGDVGQNAWEEVDYRAASRIGKLANYGWNRYEGRAVYGSSNPLLRKGQLVFPVTVYSHGQGCSITGGYVYRGAAVPAARGRYFYGDFCTSHVWSFRVGRGRTSAPALAPFSVPSLSSFGEDANGELYATSLSSGTVYKLAP